MNNDAPITPEMLRLEPQIADLARDVINKVEMTVSVGLPRSHVYARLSQCLLQACHYEMVDVEQRHRELL